MPPERRVVIIKVKNVKYECEIPEDMGVDMERVEEVLRSLMDSVQRGSTEKTVIEYLGEGIVKLAMEFLLLEQALESVRDGERD